MKFEWNSNSQESFQRPKEMLTSAPVLKIVYLDESFVVCINTCKHGIGGVLTQNGHVINYESKKMKEHEQNYAAHDLELATIIHSLNMWKHYMMGNNLN